MSVSAGDSARVSLTHEAGLQVDNYGGATDYDVRVEMASASGDTVFYHADVALQNNTSHRIVPDWRQNDGALSILVDMGMVGNFTDTIEVENEGETLCECPYQSDYDEDGFLTVLDLGSLIDVLYAGVPEIHDPQCPATRGDFNNDGFPDTVDLNGLIDYLFAGGNPLCSPCNPVQEACAE
jgi:hypothetical protein